MFYTKHSLAERWQFVTKLCLLARFDTTQSLVFSLYVTNSSLMVNSKMFAK